MGIATGGGIIVIYRREAVRAIALSGPAEETARPASISDSCLAFLTTAVYDCVQNALGLPVTDDLDRTVGARGHGGRDTAEHKAFDTPQSPRADEDAVGAPAFGFGDQQSFGLFLFYRRVSLQAGGVEPVDVSSDHLFDPGFFFDDPVGDRADHAGRSNLRRRPCGADDTGFTASRPFARGDGLHSGLGVFRTVNPDDKADRRIGLFDATS